MNLLLSCIGQRGHLAEWFRERMGPGDRIIGTSNSRWTSGFHVCDMSVLMPDVSSDEYVPAMLDLCSREGVDGLLSFLDEDVLTLSRHRDRFVELGVVPVLPDAWAAELCVDKLATTGHLRSRGISTPATWAGLEDALEAVHSGELVYPVIVKPRVGTASRDLFLADGPRELEDFMVRRPGMIAQERIVGVEVDVDILSDLERRVVSVVVKRKVRMRDGGTDMAVTIHHPGALRTGVQVGEALGAVGPLDVDAFIQGDTVTVIEVNPRMGAAYPFSHLAGADFPGRILAMLSGSPVTPDIGAYAAGVEGIRVARTVAGYDGPIVDRRSGAGGRGS